MPLLLQVDLEDLPDEPAETPKAAADKPLSEIEEPPDDDDAEVLMQWTQTACKMRDEIGYNSMDAI